MIQLSVNVNKIATLRNARGGLEPSVRDFAQKAIDAGAYGITVHPRPDERHITTQDVYDLVEVVQGVEYNLEGYPDERYRALVREVKPAQATLVPDPPGVLTSNAGWKASEHLDFLKDAVQELQSVGSRVSLFMETDLKTIDAARETGADRIELYTGPFAEAFARGEGITAFAPYSQAALHATGLGFGLNAGHDLNLANLTLFRQLPGLAEVSIGHALTCDALRIGWEPAVKAYLDALKV
ncbi:MAG: pyridoxine 5'-phosphate synthase [Deltaproteobacteria bacterium]|nr:pyridoxine 5'-phosphate synthase [Deltaproteobacteria bacterium]